MPDQNDGQETQKKVKKDQLFAQEKAEVQAILEELEQKKLGVKETDN